MDKRVQNALEAAIETTSSVQKIAVEEFKAELFKIYDAEASFVDKLSLQDKAFDENPQLESLREVFFDLLLVNFFSEDVKKLEEDYLESEEWETIEEDTIERGTELLNLLLYLRECSDEEIEPSLEDYLKEFLLVDEDEFQDEHRIYEDVIAHQALIESNYEEISRVAKKLPEDSEIGELFYPMLSFFRDLSPAENALASYAKNSLEPEFDIPVLALLTAYNKP